MIKKKIDKKNIIIIPYRYHKEKRRKFLCSNNAHPQTTAIVKTRCEALGIKFEIFDGSKDVFDGVKPLTDTYNLAEYCGILVHYPDSNGNVDNLESIVNLAKATETIVIAATDLLALTMVKPPGEYGQFCDIAIGTAQRFGMFHLIHFVVHSKFWKHVINYPGFVTFNCCSICPMLRFCLL